MTVDTRHGRRGQRVLLLSVLCVTAGLAAGCASGSAAVSPTTPTAYVVTGANVANPGDTVAVVNLSARKKQPPITVGTLPAAVAVTPNGQDVLVAVKGEDELSEIDVASGAVVGQAMVGVEPDAVAVTPDGSLALVANFDDNTVTPVALPSLRSGRPVPVGREPVSVAVSPDGRLALVADYEDDTVTPISLPGLVAGPPIAAGQEPVDVFISARRHRRRGRCHRPRGRLPDRQADPDPTRHPLSRVRPSRSGPTPRTSSDGPGHPWPT